jgi:hypothetical protein
MDERTSPATVAVTCTLDRPSVADAGQEFSLTARFTCLPACDLEGETVELVDEGGIVVGRAFLGAFDEENGANAVTITGGAPASVAEHTWSLKLDAYQDDDVQYGGVTTPVPIEVRAHETAILVWNVPTAVVAGTPFTITIGIKCSSGCRQAHREIAILDHAGKVLARLKAAELWPKSEALYYARTTLPAPSLPGQVLEWQAQCVATELDQAEGSLPHGAGKAAFKLRCVKQAEVRLRVEAWDAKEGIPLPGTRIVLHPYSAQTDENGIAEVEVAPGHYRLFASRPKYTTLGTSLEVAGDISTRVELQQAPPPNRE